MHYKREIQLLVFSNILKAFLYSENVMTHEKTKPEYEPGYLLEIINSTETDTFGKKPKFTKLLRELSQCPYRTRKKSFGFSRMSAIVNLLCFGSFAAG